jgi:hypothetical protein
MGMAAPALKPMAFDLQQWRQDLRACENSEEWLCQLATSLDRLHAKSVDNQSVREMTCAELIEIAISQKVCGDLHFTQTNALRELAGAADKLDQKTGNVYHRSSHIRETILSVIALMDRYESLGNQLSNDTKFNAICTMALHDNGHYSQKGPNRGAGVEINTTATALTNGHLTSLSIHYHLAPIVVGSLATAFPFFATADSLDERAKKLLAQPAINKMYPTLQIRSEDHILLAQIAGAADLLPSLCDETRLILGAARVTKEENLNKVIHGDDVLETAQIFLGAVKPSGHPYKALFELDIPWERHCNMTQSLEGLALAASAIQSLPKPRLAGRFAGLARLNRHHGFGY